MASCRFFNLLMAVVFSFSFLGTSAHALARDAGPVISVQTNRDWVVVSNWPVAANLTLTVDDPAAPAVPDFTTSQYTQAASSAWFYLQWDYALKPGDVVAVTDGATTRSTVVTSLAVTAISYETDKLSGIAAPGSTVNVTACDTVERRVVAASNGTWTIDFSRGDTLTLCDILPGAWTSSWQTDAAGNETRIYQPAPNPRFDVIPNWDWVELYGWPYGDMVTIRGHHPGDSASQDFTWETQITEYLDWDQNTTFARLYLGAGLTDFRSGDTVTVSDGRFTKTLTIVDVKLTNIDTVHDIVYGTASPGLSFTVHASIEDLWVQRLVTAGPSGGWQADFSQPNPGGDGAIDLQPGVGVGAGLTDADGDGSWYNSKVWDVAVQVDPSHPDVQGVGWPEGGLVKLTVEDSEHKPLYEFTQNPDFGYWCGYPCFDLYGMPGLLQAGQYVTLTQADDSVPSINGGALSRTVKIGNIHVSDANTTTGMVSGTADPDSSVRVDITGGDSRTATADENGNWSAPFAHIGPNDSGTALLLNGDGWNDGTLAYWSASPRLRAWTSNDVIEGWGWLAGTVHYSINNNFSATVTVSPGSAPTHFSVDLHALYDIKAGDVITVSDGTHSRTMTAQAIAVTSFDVPGGTFWGTVGPGLDPLFIALDNPQVERVIWSHGDGNWDWGFSDPQGAQPVVQIQPGQTGTMWVSGPDGDETAIRWTAPVATAAGTGVSVSPTSYLDIHLGAVTQAGYTGVYETNQQPDPLPANFQVLGQGYDVVTTAQFTSAQVCFDYDDTALTLQQENAVRLLHQVNGVWVDVTDAGYPNTTTNQVCGTVQSFSPFVATVNHNPAIETVVAPVDPGPVGQVITASASFSDPDAGQDFAATWDWGDGTTSAGTVNGKSATGSHTYASPGIYTLKLTVTDNAGGVGTGTAQNFSVFYDPNGGTGLVTGGGWIVSPAGAYTANPALSGKATFGFVSKYQKGAHVPSGDTDFQFQTAGLYFESTSYEWLVVGGSKAQFKGSGTINDTGNYGFLLTATDGTVDKFRIKIWDKASDTVVYDNQLGAADTADPATVLAGGSIVIHK